MMVRGLQWVNITQAVMLGEGNKDMVSQGITLKSKNKVMNLNETVDSLILTSM